MARVSQIGLHDFTVTDKVEHQHVNGNKGSFECITLADGVCVYFDGHDNESEDNLLGFLDRMHAIRNAVLQDRADRTEVAR